MSQVKVEEQIGGVIVHLRGQFIGGEETDVLRDVLKKYAEEKKNKLIINFEKATYLNSTALGVLIAAHSNFAKRGGEIILCNLDKSLENIFIITKLITVFNVADDLQSAIKML
ncbi:MAG TPA: STAS domain-containing protein [Candidatus Kapabacteria bacterium]|nr:STAS domain-containing protein [Candidatus Kapabacteria bacterium]